MQELSQLVRVFVTSLILKNVLYTIVNYQGKPPVKIVHINWYKRTIGWWNFHLGHLLLKFYSYGNGWIRINNHPIKLIPSKNPRLPASQGYVTFKWKRYTIYLRFIHNTIHIYQFAPWCHLAFNHVPGLCTQGNGAKGEIE